MRTISSNLLKVALVACGMAMACSANAVPIHMPGGDSGAVPIHMPGGDSGAVPIHMPGGDLDVI